MTDSKIEYTCAMCEEPSKVAYKEGETPSDMFWCEGISHNSKRIAHKTCGGYGEELGETRMFCQECLFALEMEQGLDESDDW